ncbi:MAG: glycosyl transferase [Pseudomonadota bacterium]
MSKGPVTGVSGYSFSPADLNLAERREGLSAFMRIKNGAEFLEATVRSHIHHFDEVVAVYNGCTDATEDILIALRAEYGPRLRLFHYRDRVFPPGSEGHKKTPADDPSSIVNYSNFALAQTRYRTVTKLDDDHLAIEEPLRALVSSIRAGDQSASELWAFSGLNLAPSKELEGAVEVLQSPAISGKGDIGFFEVNERSYFRFDPRFERFEKREYRRVFKGFTYWHLKSLKDGMGFANYELEDNPNSRFARKQEAMRHYKTVALADLKANPSLPWSRRLAALVSDKARIATAQAAALQRGEPSETIEEALQRLSALTVLPR